MAITDILENAQGGAFYLNIAAATGLDAAAAQQAIVKFAPAIAAKLKAKASTDPEAFENLLDLLADGDGSDLNDPDAITGSEAVSDGREILEDIYGSSASAQSTLEKLAPSLDTAAVAKLGAISATSVLAALAASNVQTLSSSTTAAAGTSGGGFFSVLIAAMLKAFIQSAQRQIAPRRRRRRYTTYTRRRTPSRSRRSTSVGLDDIFKEILGGRR